MAERRSFRRAARSPLFVGACVVLGLVIGAGLLADVVAPYSPTAVGAAQMFAPPSVGHPLGTDRFGRDLLSRIVHGVRVSLGIAGASILAAVVAGGALGLLAGLGRGVDQVLGRVMDVFFAFPPILLAIAVAAVLGAGVGTAIVAIAVVYGPFFFRVVRGSVLVESTQGYVEAAVALGAGRLPRGGADGRLSVLRDPHRVGALVSRHRRAAAAAVVGHAPERGQGIPRPGAVGLALSGRGHRAGRPRVQHRG
jgi:ABC-type dipeptide/oligopeptide/nickel transport system permease subunit